MQELHHRMPVILEPDAYGAWLDPDCHDPDALNAILKGKALTALIFHPVAKQVNAVRHNDPSNIEPAPY
jgi:putative SOS response-associated peptidase YedK